MKKNKKEIQFSESVKSIMTIVLSVAGIIIVLMFTALAPFADVPVYFLIFGLLLAVMLVVNIFVNLKSLKGQPKAAPKGKKAKNKKPAPLKQFEKRRKSEEEPDPWDEDFPHSR